MNNESTSIRHRFLAQACRFTCSGRLRIATPSAIFAFGMPALQPIPISNQQQKH